MTSQFAPRPTKGDGRSIFKLQLGKAEEPETGS